MSTGAIVLSVVGSTALFMVGFGQVTGVLIRRFRPAFRETVTTPGTQRVHRFFSGVRLAAAGGSGASGVVSLITIADGRAREVEDTQAVFLGINLGGTVACWLLALAGFRFGLTPIALPILAITLPFRLSTALKRHSAADFLTGLALVMLAIDFASGRLPLQLDVTGIPVAMERFTAGVASPFVAFLVGVIVAIVLRSSVGTVFLAMALSVRGWLPFETAAALVLGSNAGPAATAYLAARGFGPTARRTAVSYMLVNSLAIVFGAAILPFLIPLAARILPGRGIVTGVVLLASFHTAVHLLNILVTTVLHRPVRALSIRAVPDVAHEHRDSGVMEGALSLNLLPPGFPDSLDANLVLTQSALASMADRAYEMLMIVINVSQMEEGVQDATERIIHLRGHIKDLEEQISIPLTRSVQLPCTRLQAERIQQQQRIAQELSLIADDCYKTMRLLERSYRKNYRFHRESSAELFDFTSQILDFLRYNSDYLEGRIERPDWDVAERMEDTIDSVRDKLKKRSRKVLEKSEDADIRGELAFIDIISHLEHVGDRCLSIADTVRRLSRS